MTWRVCDLALTTQLPFLYSTFITFVVFPAIDMQNFDPVRETSEKPISVELFYSRKMITTKGSVHFST